MNKDWDLYFLGMAEYVAKKSKDPSTKAGCVFIGEDKGIVSTGYNGFPSKIEDRPEWLNDRDVKYPLTLHAEVNAIIFSARHGRTTIGSTAYVWPLSPCTPCMMDMIQAGIVRVVAPNLAKDTPKRWRANMMFAEERATEAGIEVVRYNVVPKKYPYYYVMESHCEKCDNTTTHYCSNNGHERDSSYEYDICLVCGWDGNCDYQHDDVEFYIDQALKIINA